MVTFLTHEDALLFLICLRHYNQIYYENEGKCPTASGYMCTRNTVLF